MIVNKEPLVSICIPTFNGEKYIFQALQSTIAQTYPNLEIVISDDNSSDGTLNIIKQFKSHSSFPIYIYSHAPKGIGANWNNCIKRANGEYIKFLFQDDVLLPTCIEEMISVVRQNTLINMVSCKRTFIIEDSFLTNDSENWIETYRDLQKDLSLDFENDVAYIDSKIFHHKSFFDSPLNKVGEPSCLLFKSDLVNSIGYYRSDLRQILDYEFCYRVLKFEKIAIVNKPLVEFRLHSEQTTVQNKKGDVYARDHSIYLNILYKDYYKFLDKRMKKKLIRKFNPIAAFLYDIIDQFRRKYLVKWMI